MSAPGNLFNLAGKTVLVTGASGGLGRGIAAAMAGQGARLILSDAERPAATAPHLAFAADLSRADDVRRLADDAIAAGGVDVLVCNAGVREPAGPLHDVNDADWERVMAINLRSTITLSARLAPQMAARGGGSIVLMASIAGLRGNKAIGLYGLSKAALAQLPRNLAVERGPKGVRVNAISPGLIDTPLAASLMRDEPFMRRRLAMTPLRRVGQPHEVVGVAVMLVSAAGAFVTGQNLVVDGGTLISDGN